MIDRALGMLVCGIAGDDLARGGRGDRPGRTVNAGDFIADTSWKRASPSGGWTATTMALVRPGGARRTHWSMHGFPTRAASLGRDAEDPTRLVV